MNAGSDGSAPTGGAFLRVAWRVVGGLAALLVVFLLVGWALPGTWRASRTQVLAHPPAAVFPLISDVGRWPEWMAFGEVATSPLEGGGAGLSWDDPAQGSGSLELLSATPDREVRYEVQVVGGLHTLGRFQLSPESGGTRLEWTEEGDFGGNPLLAYFALGMDRLQGNEMIKSLERLERLLGTQGSR